VIKVMRFKKGKTRDEGNKYWLCEVGDKNGRINWSLWSDHLEMDAVVMPNRNTSYQLHNVNARYQEYNNKYSWVLTPLDDFKMVPVEIKDFKVGIKI
jgi:hypothetical protein